jgi:hypothetical protein
LLRKVGDMPGLEPLFLDEKYQLNGEDRSLLHDGDWPWLKWKTKQPENPPDDLKTDA